MGNGNLELYVVFQPGDAAYDDLGIDKIGAISSESLFIHFNDDQKMQEWRTSDRSIGFTATDNEFYVWEGGWNLNTENEDHFEGDLYNYAHRDFGAEPTTDVDYEDAVQDDSADTAIVNDYSPVNTIDFIEYSMNNMGISTEIAADLANHVNTAGAGGHALNIVLI